MLSLATTLGLTSVGEKANSTISTAEEGFGQEVVFETEDGVLQRGFYNSYQPIVIPEAPEVEGSTFEGWTIDGTTVASEEEVKKAMASDAGKVTLTPKYAVNVIGITINPSALTLELGNSAAPSVDVDYEGEDITKWAPYQNSESVDEENNITMLAMSVNPSTAAYKTIVWMSSDPSIATVDSNGKVTAVAVGTAIITATATNGTDDTGDDKSATCTVTITAPSASVKFKGGSLRRRAYVGTDTIIDFETDIRFGFDFTLPEGATINTEKSYFRWTKNEPATADTGKQIMIRNCGQNGSVFTANMVITAVPKAAYTTNLHCFVHLEYTLDDQNYMIESSASSAGAYVLNVKDVCNSMIGDLNTSDMWKDYAQFLLDAISS